MDGAGQARMLSAGPRPLKREWAVPKPYLQKESAPGWDRLLPDRVAGCAEQLLQGAGRPRREVVGARGRAGWEAGGRGRDLLGRLQEVDLLAHVQVVVRVAVQVPQARVVGLRTSL